MIFSPIQVVKNRYLLVPYDMRSALGLHEGLQMHLSLFDTAEQDTLLTELIASPIPLTQRADLWVMKASFYDRPGLMAELTTFLKELNIDIVSCKGITGEHNKYCHVELVIDNRLYKSDFDRDSHHRTANEILLLKALEAKITARFIEDILFSHSDMPLITIYRNITLFRSLQSLSDRDIVRLTNERILLPREVLKNIYKKYSALYPDIKKLKSEKKLPLAAMVADPENALLRILIFYRNTGHLHIRIKARNKVGTLSEITTHLNQAKFNLYQMYTRNIEPSNTFSLTDLLIKLPLEHDQFKDDDRLRTFISRIFRNKHLQELEIEVSFPDFLSESHT